MKKWRRPIIKHGKLTRYNWLVFHPENLKLGRYTDIGCFSLIDATFGVEIGDYVQLGSHVSVYSHNTIDGTKGKVVIGRNAKIGSHSVILPHVKIGENAKIGAFSFVNKNIPKNALAYGIPVKVIAPI